MSTFSLSRRTVLRGLGASLALPWLEAMTVSSARGAESKPPVRMGFLYVPNGMHMPDWTPAKTGSDFEIPKTLQPLSAFRKDMTVLSGLTLNGARSLGDGGGDHARSVAAFLTGAHPKKTSGADIRNGVSVDQVAAEKIGLKTKLPSLELGLERSAQAGRCDSGYSCVYTSNMSWRSQTSPVAKEVDPAAVFERMFGSAEDRRKSKDQETLAKSRKSILDFVLEDAKSLQRKLGGSDQQKLDEYLYAVRDVERRITSVDKLSNRQEEAPDFPRPTGVPRDREEHLKILFDLMVLAFQTDSTRVCSLMYTNAGSNRSYPEIGVREGHHSLSHHGNNRDKQAKIQKINQLHVEQFSYLVKKLSEVREGDSRLLDNCMVMYGSGIGDGNRHNHDHLPVVLLGSGGRTIKTGQHLEYDRDTPLTNLYLSMLDRVGASVESLGDSTGRLKNLG